VCIEGRCGGVYLVIVVDIDVTVVFREATPEQKKAPAG
jgi:hypothetical protein